MNRSPESTNILYSIQSLIITQPFAKHLYDPKMLAEPEV